MILDDHPDDTDIADHTGDDAEVGELADDGGGVGEWHSGLRSVGLPVLSAPVGIRRRAGRQASSGVRELAARSWSDSTRTSYEADWRHFSTWMSVHAGVDDPLEADDLDIAEYIAVLVGQRLAMSTIRRRMAAIRWAFTIAERTSPTTAPGVELILAGAANTLGTVQDQAAALRLEDLRTMLIALPIVHHRRPAVLNHRDQVLLAVGWAAALRCSELVALDVDDLTFTRTPDEPGGGGLLVRVRHSKTDQTAKQASVAVPYSTHIATCPVRLALQHVRRVRTGALFRRIDRHGRILDRLGPDAVSRIVQRHITTLLQMPADVYSSHSLRAGFVTEARAHHVEAHLIARHTRHKDLRMLATYDRPTDLFNDPALDDGWW